MTFLRFLPPEGLRAVSFLQRVSIEGWALTSELFIAFSEDRTVVRSAADRLEFGLGCGPVGLLGGVDEVDGGLAIQFLAFEAFLGGVSYVCDFGNFWVFTLIDRAFVFALAFFRLDSFILIDIIRFEGFFG